MEFTAGYKDKAEVNNAAKGYITDKQRQMDVASFLDSESRDDRSSQLSFVNDKEFARQPAIASNSTVVIQSGLQGLLSSGVTVQPRKSILPQIDYTNKYVKRQSRHDSATELSHK